MLSYWPRTSALVAYNYWKCKCLSSHPSIRKKHCSFCFFPVSPPFFLFFDGFLYFFRYFLGFAILFW